MKKLVLLLLISLTALIGCVSQKEFQASNSKISIRITEIENQIVLIDNQIYNLEIKTKNLQNQTSANYETQNQQINELTDLIGDLEEQNSNLKNLVNELRIEVALLKKKIN